MTRVISSYPTLPPPRIELKDTLMIISKFLRRNQQRLAVMSCRLSKTPKALCERYVFFNNYIFNHERKARLKALKFSTLKLK